MTNPKIWFISTITPNSLHIGDSQVGDWTTIKEFLSSDFLSSNIVALLTKSSYFTNNPFYAYKIHNHKITHIFTLKDAIRYEKIAHL